MNSLLLGLAFAMPSSAVAHPPVYPVRTVVVPAVRPVVYSPPGVVAAPVVAPQPYVVAPNRVRHHVHGHGVNVFFSNGTVGVRVR